MTAAINSITFEQASSRWLYEPETGLLRFRSTGLVAGGDCMVKLDYRRVCGFGRQFAAHRIAWLLATGEWPRFEIDHENGVRWDNRWTNIRDVPHAVNQLNQNYHRAGISRGPKIRAGKIAVRAAIARIEAERAARRVTSNADFVTSTPNGVTSNPVTGSRAHALSEGRSHCHSDVTQCVCDVRRDNQSQTGSLRDPSGRGPK